ncbi:MAG: DUF5691 domain-containing protein [Arachnia sp.]
MSLTHAELVSAAIVGTSTRPVTREQLPPELASRVAADDPADLLLDAAAGYAVVHRARLPGAAQITESELPPEQRPQISPAFASLLRRLHSGTNEERTVLTEALNELARRHGNRLALPSALLVSLLDTPPGSGSVALLAALRAVLGPADLAFAALGPGWLPRLTRGETDLTDAQADDDDVWQHGSHTQRVALLTSLRGSDPARATALLTEAAIAKEPAAQRAQLLETLALGISAADTDLLEGLLGDRSKTVRGVVADLLGRIPTSATARLAEQVALAHLSITLPEAPQGGFLSRMMGRGQGPQPITVAASSVAADPELARRGIDARSGRVRLEEVLSHVPTSRWPELVGATATELLGAVWQVDGVDDTITDAWAQAATRWRDPQLALALLAQRQVIVEDIDDFVEPAQLEPALAVILASHASTYGWQVLRRLPERLAPQTAAQLIDLIGVWLRDKQVNVAVEAAQIVAERVRLEDAAALAERLAAAVAPWQEHRNLQRSPGLLRLRAAIPEALDSCPDSTGGSQ